MLSGTSAANASSLGRFRFNGSGSDDEALLEDEPAEADVAEPEAEEPEAEEPEADAEVDDPDDDDPPLDEDAADPPLALPPDAPDPPLAFGFWVVAPHAATMPATARAAITVPTRDKRVIRHFLPWVHSEVRPSRSPVGQTRREGSAAPCPG